MAEQNALVAVRMDLDEAKKYGDVFVRGRAVGPSLSKEIPLDVLPLRIAAVVMAGAELGFTPFTSIAGISIVEGKPRLSYQLLGSLVRRSGKYDYRVQRLDNDAAEIEFLELDGAHADPAKKWRPLGVSTFTAQDAETAGLLGQTQGGKLRDPWHKYRRNMLFARAMSNGINWFCPDVANGCPVYSEDVEDEDVRTYQGRAVALGAAVAKDPASKPIPSAPAQASAPPPKELEAKPQEVVEPAKTIPVPTETSIVRPDGSSTPLNHASGVIENARLEEERAKAEAAKKRAPRKKKISDEAPAGTVPAGGDAGGTTSQAAPGGPAPTTIASQDSNTNPPASPASPTTEVNAAPPENPKVDVGHASPDEVKKDEERLAATAAAMGVKPGDGPLAPDAPAKQKDHPGVAALGLENEVAKVEATLAIDMKTASKAHTIGINHYGSDAAARAAWQHVGYSLPKRGEKVATFPTAKQVREYLAEIIRREEQKELAQDAGSPFGDMGQADF